MRIHEIVDAQQQQLTNQIDSLKQRKRALRAQRARERAQQAQQAATRAQQRATQPVVEDQPHFLGRSRKPTPLP